MPAKQRESSSSQTKREGTAQTGPAAADKPAFKCPGAITVFLVLTALALAGDLASKHWVFRSLLNDPDLQARMNDGLRHYQGEPTAKVALIFYQRPVMPGVKFTLSTNAGVAFGMPMYRGLVAAATLLTVGMVCYFFATSTASAHGVHVALALILGGALGNLYDRLLGKVVVEGFEPIRYQVRDFVDCSELGYRWVWNVADAWLVIGVGLLVIHWWLAARAQKKAAGKTA